MFGKDVAAHQGTSSLNLPQDPFSEDCSVEFMKDMPAADMEAREFGWYGGQESLESFLE